MYKVSSKFCFIFIFIKEDGLENSNSVAATRVKVQLAETAIVAVYNVTEGYNLLISKWNWIIKKGKHIDPMLAPFIVLMSERQFVIKAIKYKRKKWTSTLHCNGKIIQKSFHRSKILYKIKNTIKIYRSNLIKGLSEMKVV